MATGCGHPSREYAYKGEVCMCDRCVCAPRIGASRPGIDAAELRQGARGSRRMAVSSTNWRRRRLMAVSRCRGVGRLLGALRVSIEHRLLAGAQGSEQHSRHEEQRHDPQRTERLTLRGRGSGSGHASAIGRTYSLMRRMNEPGSWVEEPIRFGVHSDRQLRWACRQTSWCFLRTHWTQSFAVVTVTPNCVAT
jgi:hypothetical protein